MIKIAVLADLHLPDHPGTVKEDAFEWALTTAVQQQADVIVLAGDVTSVGTLAATERMKQKLDTTGLPYLIVPGNAEYRTPDATGAVLKILQTPVVFEQNGCYAVVLDNSRQCLTDEGRVTLRNLERQGVKPIFVAAHFPLDYLPPEDKDFLTELIASGCIGLFVAGHNHIDAFEHIGKGESHMVRGIDPDKAIGGSPALTFFEYDSSCRQWQRTDIAYPVGCALSWTDQQRNEFSELLGISCMGDTSGGIADAIRLKIRCVELRFECTGSVPREELCALVEQWRNGGGKYLSIHFPDIARDSETGAVKGEDLVKEACELALELGADMLTMHVPRCPVGLVSENVVRSQLLNAYAEALKPVLNNGITVGIENLHMNPGETPGVERGFGYTPSECLDWINALRERTASDRIGFHFDIGHARNNAPYSSLYNISQWFAETGAMITGYHLHQVELDAEGRFLNHRPVTGMFGPLISFSSLFAAWSRRQINHVPMYLEIRDGGGLVSLQCFRKYLNS